MSDLPDDVRAAAYDLASWLSGARDPYEYEVLKIGFALLDERERIIAKIEDSDPVLAKWLRDDLFGGEAA